MHWRGDANGGAGYSCTTCHPRPIWTSRLAASSLSQETEVPHLRGLYQRIGMFGYAVPGLVRPFPYLLDPRPTPHMGDQIRGFGFTHDGSVPTLYDFFRRPFGHFIFKDDPGRSGSRKIRQIEAYLLAYSTGLAPVVGHQVTLSAPILPRAQERLQILANRAREGDCELVMRGYLAGEARAWLYTGDGPNRSGVQSDRRAETGALPDLLAEVEKGAILTATCVPPGSGARAALDRDEDGAYDRDEVDAGADPADPFSCP